MFLLCLNRVYEYYNLSTATIFCAKKHLFIALIFSQLIVFILCKIILSVRNNFTNNEHVFLRTLVTNLPVLCFDICDIPAMCTPYYQSRLNLVSEICLVNILMLYISRNNSLRVLTYVCEHSNIKCF